MKLTTINQIVQAIVDEGDTIGKLEKARVVANEATIYLKTALICETKGIDKAMEYFTGTHDAKEYVEWLTAVAAGGENG